MNLEVLKIRNIASIKEAEIHFNKPPLGDAPLFLIYGDTGAGKSTLLNAICLALYNTAPNLQAIPSKDKDAEEVSFNSPLQLMRKGAVQASVELTYEDSDHYHYTAKWETHRAHNKPNGELQGPNCTLWCHETDTLITGITKMAPKVRETVGLDYEQFCRTTMLAQGQFSKFMNAGRDEKTSILEKLTGTEHYAQIGRQIFTLYKNKESECTAVEHQIEGMSSRLLPEEQRAQMQQELSTLQPTLQQQEEQQKVLLQQLNWMQQYDTLRDNITKAQEKHHQLQVQSSAEETALHRRLLQDWEATTDIRSTMQQQQNAQQSLRQSMDKKQSLSQEYAVLHAALLYEQQEIDRTQAQLQEKQQLYKAEEPHKETYAAATLIENTLQALQKQLADYQKKQGELTALQQQSSSLATTLQEKKRDADTQKQQYQAALAATEQLRKDLDDKHLPELTETVRTLTLQIGNMEHAARQLQDLQDKEKNLQALEGDLDLLRNRYKEADATCKQATQQLPEAEAEWQRRKSHYEGQQDLITKLAVLAERFRDTHTCPLCGSEVPHLHGEEVLLQTAEQSRRLTEEQQQRVEALRKIRQDAITTMESLKRSAQTQKQQCQTLKDACTSLKNTLLPQLSAWGIAAIDGSTQEQLRQLWQQRKQDFATANQALTEANELNKKLQQSLTETETRRKQWEGTQQNLQSCEETVNQTNSNIHGLQLLQQQLLADMQEKQNLLRQYISLPETLDTSLLQTLRKDITTGAARYAQLEADIRTLTQTIENSERQHQVNLNHLRQLEGDYPLPDNLKPQPLPDLENHIQRLLSEVHNLNGEIYSRQELLKGLQAQQQQYFALPDSLPEERVRYLLQLPQQEVLGYKQELQRLDDALNEATGACRHIEQQIKEWEATRPAMPEGCTRGTLELQHRQLSEEIEQLKNRTVELKTRLDDDSRNAVQTAEKQQALKQLQKEKDNWSRLNEHFGGAGGDKFRRIAQSFVLQALLEKSNYYLQLLTSRYLLGCEEGSLAIHVTDLHQGGEKRNVGLLSGGESFIVSLALALGLASISVNRFDVDTLFIDEGFGTLDRKSLETVIDTLDRLHRLGGRKVGVISHVEELAGRIRTQIQVLPDGPGTSRVAVTVE